MVVGYSTTSHIERINPAEREDIKHWIVPKLEWMHIVKEHKQLQEIRGASFFVFETRL